MVTNENSGENAEKLTDVKAVIAFLAEKFPQCFSIEGEAKPLKIGIFRDLAERVEDDGLVSRTQLRHALRRYTSSWRYLKCVAKGGLRVDLDGNQGDALEADHIEHAAKTLEDSKAKAQLQRKAAKDKKTYKKSHSDTGANGDKQAKFKDNRQKADAQSGGSHHTNGAKGAGKGKPSGKRSDKSANTGAAKRKDSKGGPSQSKPVTLKPLGESDNRPGTAVLVRFGQSPVPGVIKEVAKEEIHVQLNSGMVIKTRFENVFLA